MCEHCDYQKMLESNGLEATENRLRVLTTLGESISPLTATDILEKVEATHSINKVTVYRILDILVENNLLERLSSGTRAAYFGIAPNEHHAPHPHFYCTKCGSITCLKENSIRVDMSQFKTLSHAQIERVEIRIDGICENCLPQQSPSSSP